MCSLQRGRRSSRRNTPLRVAALETPVDHPSTRPPFFTAEYSRSRKGVTLDILQRGRRASRRNTSVAPCDAGPRPSFNEAAVLHGGIHGSNGESSCWIATFNEAAVLHGGIPAQVRNKMAELTTFNEAAVLHGGIRTWSARRPSRFTRPSTRPPFFTAEYTQSGRPTPW